MEEAMDYLHSALADLTEDQSVTHDRVLNTRLSIMLKIVDLFYDNNGTPTREQIDNFMSQQFLL